METSKQPELTIEGADAQRRYELILYHAQECLRGTALVLEKEWTPDDISQTRQLFLASAPFAHPQILPSYWEHIILSSIYGRKLSQLTNHPDLNPYEAECLLLINDLGRLVAPHRYLRNDLIAQRLSQKLGIRKSFLQKFPSMFKLLDLEPRPYRTLADMPEVQRITFVADNIGKKDSEEKLFNVKSIVSWSVAQPRRYIPDSPFPSEKRGLKALVEEGKQQLDIELLLQAIQNLAENYGIDFDQLREEVAKEFSQPENQAFLLGLKDAQESLDFNVDRLLKRPLIKAVVFDAGNVLFQGKEEMLDNELVRKMAKFFECLPNQIISIFKTLYKGGMPGQISEQHYLGRFWVLAGRKPPDNIKEQRAPFIQPDIYHPSPKMQEIVTTLSKNPQIKLYVLSDAIEVLGLVIEPLLHRLYPEIPRENIFISSQVGTAKGVNAQMTFPRLLAELKCDPQQVLFIDDSEQYTVSARTLYEIRGFTFRANPHRGLSAEEKLKQELQKAELIP